MKHRIFYSTGENLYQVQSKRIFGGWKNRSIYFFTDSKGNVNRTSGFATYVQAEEWLRDRYPGIDLLKSANKNTNMGFEF